MNLTGLFFKKTLVILIILSSTDSGSVYAQKSKEGGNLIIKSIELGYPSPGIPFYHFKAEIELPQASIIEIEAAVNGKILRSTDLYRSIDMVEENRPTMTHRPPSGYGLSQDATLYKNPLVIGWVKWQPGDNYEIRMTVRLKKSVQGSKDDLFLSSVRKIKAPEKAQVFDPAWKSYKSVVLSETAGVHRKAEPIEVLLPFYPDEAKHLTREIRVVSVDPRTFSLSEVPCQVYDIMEDLKEDDLAPDAAGKATRNVPLWLPTLTARIAFLADVPARSSRVFLIFYNNEDAVANVYETDLKVQGEEPGLQIENNKISVVLHPNSGHLDQLALKSKPEVLLYHRMETSGAIHWNPDIYKPPLAWTHTADWKPPENVRSFSGPVIASSEVWGSLRGVPEADAAVRYEFYPGVPYFISTTTLRIKKTISCLALRNAEIVFKREQMDHAAWYDIIRDTIITYNVSEMPDLTDLKMEADVPWLTFYNEKTGIGFAGINLGYANVGLESRPRLLNPYFYITAGPWIYWCRALSLTFLSSNMQQVIPVMEGNVFYEKWAYVIYETDKERSPYSPVIDWQKRLTSPLRLQLVEEVDDRVSKTVEEVFMDEGKSGWEGRETGRNK
jgi:hypothetical protein